MTCLPVVSLIFRFFIFKAIAAREIVIGDGSEEGGATEGSCTIEGEDEEKKQNERFRSQSPANFEGSCGCKSTSLQWICGNHQVQY